MNQKTQSAKEIQLPVTKLSYSSLTLLLRNPIIFKLKEILGIYDDRASMSSMIGRAGHLALKFYYGGDKTESATIGPEGIAEAKQKGLDFLAKFPEENINYGKTGSREEMLKGFTQAMDFFFAEEPVYHEILVVEEKMEGPIKAEDGQDFPLPAVGIPDIVYKDANGDIIIEDRKFTTSFTDYSTEDYIKIIQAIFMKKLLLSAKGIRANRADFLEIKRTKNKDGGNQLRRWSVPLNHEPYEIIFCNLFRDVVKYLTNDPIFLPNLSDPIDGEHAGLIYAQGLINSDMSDVEVMHKVREVAFTTKKFVASKLDSAINTNLRPEEKIKVKLSEFGIPVEPVDTKVGASVTQYQFKVSAGVRMSTILKHTADIAKAIEAKGEIRILAPIPGTSLVGVEVANGTRTAAYLDAADLIKDTLSIPVGITVQGETIKVPLNEMPHLLIAGATGSGKSILIHAILTALTKQMKPKDMQLILIDPKRVELAAFSKVKHLHGGKIVYEYADSLMLLKALTEEMERRYKLLEAVRMRDITEYNAEAGEKLPYIVMVIDEFGDLIMQGKQFERRKKSAQSLSKIATRVKVEAMARQCAKMGIPYNPKLEDEEIPSADEMIVRLAAMARAVGIHLIIATQRPSVDVISGLIKANFPTRIALTVASPTDSKVILGEEGAEKLTGKGDMIFMHPGSGGRVRLQGFLSKQ